MTEAVELPLSASGRDPLTVARAAAAVANELMLRGFRVVGDVQEKGRGNVVTATDLAVEAAVSTLLAREYPEHAILSEETAAGTRSDGWMWVIDPVDGTKNFSRGVPEFAFNIALCFERQPVVALTFNPLNREEFSAVRGGGTWLNGQRVRATSCESLERAFVAMGFGYTEVSGRKQIAFINQVFPRWQSFRINGSAALGMAFAAAGRWDVWLHRDLQPWDIAPGLLLVREAGGVAVEPDGQEAGIYSAEVVCGAAGACADVVAAIKQIGEAGG